MTWRKTYESPKMIKYAKKGKEIEIYSEMIRSLCSPSYVKPEKRWFVAIIGKNKIEDGEFITKLAAMKFAKRYMLKKVI
jgi:hypothetical protein